MPYKVDPLTRDELDETLRNYVCSTCWGALSFKFVNGQWLAICPACDEETVGYTSKSFAERRRGESEHEMIEAAHNLSKALGLHTKQAPEKNLHDLGF